jgi:hypothetical protein
MSMTAEEVELSRKVLNLQGEIISLREQVNDVAGNMGISARIVELLHETLLLQQKDMTEIRKKLGEINALIEERMYEDGK